MEELKKKRATTQTKLTKTIKKLDNEVDYASAKELANGLTELKHAFMQLNEACQDVITELEKSNESTAKDDLDESTGRLATHKTKYLETKFIET